MVILKGALLLNALILIHELGHFIAARWTGIAVKELSIGLGPRLFLTKCAEFPIQNLKVWVGMDSAV
jgi:regulator of sigma E protease